MRLDDLLGQLDKEDAEALLGQVTEYKEALEREKAQSSFLYYVKKMWPGFIHGRHHAVMAKMFERVASG